MAAVALFLVALWVLLVGVVRTGIHLRAGGGPVVRFQDPTGSAQWWARLLGLLAFVLLVGVPVTALIGWPLIGPLHEPVFGFVGAALAVAGMGGSVASQLAMGASWRGDVDPDARTPLVTNGPFRWVRNPRGGSSSSGLAAFAVLWVAVGAGIVWSRGSLDRLWETVTSWPILVQSLAWLLFLPIMAGLCVWESTRPLAVRLAIIAGIAGSNLLILLPRAAQTARP